MDELATHAAGGRHGGTMTQKGAYKERLLQVVSVATQVAISRRGCKDTSSLYVGDKKIK